MPRPIAADVGLDPPPPTPSRGGLFAALTAAVMLLAAGAAVVNDSPTMAVAGLLAGLGLLILAGGPRGGATLGPAARLGLGLAALLCAAATFLPGRPAPASLMPADPPPARTARSAQVSAPAVPLPAPTATIAPGAPTAAPAAPIPNAAAPTPAPTLAPSLVPTAAAPTAAPTEAPAPVIAPSPAAPVPTAVPLPAAPSTIVAPEQTGCTFQAPFANLRSLLGPAWIGDCLENEHPAGNDEVVQRTSQGVLVWRKPIDSAAFSDGQFTWANGPRGVQKRLNNERLTWEIPPSTALLPGQRVVAYRGNPLSAGLGVLGALPANEAIFYLREELRAYAEADPGRPVVGALELIATVAQAGPGADGLYRQRVGAELIERQARLAEDHGYLLVLAIQPGRAALGDEVQALLPFLRRPYVHLAIDAEFAVGRAQRPGVEVGSVDAADLSAVAATLAETAEREKLPPRLLVVHRSIESMLANAQALTTPPGVQVVLSAGGFGGPDAKRQRYDSLLRAQPGPFAGLALFYKQDRPFMRASDALELTPRPDLVTFQ